MMSDIKYKKFIKPLSLIMAVAVLFSVYVVIVVRVNKLSAVSNGNYDYNWKSNSINKSDSDYQLVSDSENVSLCVNPSNGKFFLEDKIGRKRWYSTPQNIESDNISKGSLRQEIQSEIILEYIYCVDENSNTMLRRANSKTACSAADSLSVERIDKGVKITYDFKELEIRVRVEYTLENDVFKATVLADEVEDGTKSYLVNLSLLPYFGAAGATENGYMFIPDGSGAIVRFNNGIIQSEEYEKPVYGNDSVCVKKSGTSRTENILVPVFGTVCDSGAALMGVITKGGGAAAIAAVNGNADSYYNTVYSKMNYRIYSQENSFYKNNTTNVISTVTHNEFDTEKYEVGYYFLSGENANYNGMVGKYREYLKEKYNLTAKSTAPSLALDVYGVLSEKTTSFGITYNKKRLLTDFTEAEKITEELKAAGADNLAVRYIGWSNNGVFNSEIMSDAAPLGILGGKKDFKSLCEYLNKNNIEFYPEVDTVTYAKSGSGVSVNSDSAKSPNGSKALQYAYSSVSFGILEDVKPWVLLKPELYNKATQKIIGNLEKIGVTSVSFSGFGDNLYSDFSKNGGTYRTKSVEYIEKTLSEAKKRVDGIAVSGGNIYAAVYSDRVYELPVNSSGYAIFEYDIPFVQMALHGYVKYTTPYMKQSADINTAFLKAVESGSDLLFSCVGDDSYKLSETRLSDLFSSEFSMWKDEAVKYYSEIKKISAETENAAIISHECIEKDFYKVLYSNGAAIYVNYSGEQKSVGNKTVAAGGYLLGR